MVLVITFFLALAFFYIWINRSKVEDVSKMEAPTLPVVTVNTLGTSLNRLHGYVNEMDSLYMRDAVAPVGKDRRLPLTIDTYGRKISSISYEIRSLDTERKISEADVSEFKTNGDQITAELEVANLVEDDEEVIFILKIKSEGQTIRYYSRIVMTDPDIPSKCLTFAQEFHEMAQNRDVEGLSPYIETQDSDDSSQLYDVTIHSTAKQVAWGDFDGSMVGEPLRELKDISDDYTALVYYYEMERADASGSKQRFRVEAYFKVRYTTDKMYLLDYERTMQQELDPEQLKITDGIFPLGLTDRNVNYLSNETGNLVAFVSDGNLYEYNQNTGTLVTVFSFGKGDDPRLENQEHDIMILNIDETGTMDYVVYGYMNAGAHEGVCGTDLYHYDSGMGRSVEQTFIESTKSYQILKAGFSDLIYESTSNVFYIIVDGTLLGVDLDTLETTEIKTQMSKEQYAVSGSGRYFAWIDTRTPASKIHVMDLETKSQIEVSGGSGELLRPLAFMDEDLVYGLVKEEDIGADAVGSTIYPMYKVVIAGVSDGNAVTLKEYQKDGFYVVDAAKDSYTLYLSRVIRGENGYQDTAEDTIKDSAGAKNKAVELAVASDPVLGTVVNFNMKNSDTITPKVKTAGLVNASQSRIIMVHAVDTETEYFVYVGEKVVYAGSDLTKAITLANDQMGLVLDNSQTYIWKRSRRPYVNAFNGLEIGQLDQSADARSRAISALLNYAGESVDVHTSLSRGETPLSVIESTAKNKQVLDLTGLTMNEILYFISIGNPVYTELAEDGAVLLVGYDAADIYIYHPMTGQITHENKAVIEQEILAAGSVYISYVG